MISWDPPREAFTIPLIDHPVYWYSLLFATGFLVAFLIVSKQLLSRLTTKMCPKNLNEEITVKRFAQRQSDRLAWYLFLGILIGARLGHVFFYEWDYYANHPLEIVQTWRGGLASHGGTVGIFIAAWLFWRCDPELQRWLSWREILDCLAVSVGFASGFIRLGNFCNQEILGTPSTLPWAVAFGHPLDGVAGIPRHPVQLYEAFFYFALGFILLWLRKKKPLLKPGVLTGIVVFSIYTFRIIVELYKAPQLPSDTEWLHMGQILSLPLVLFGAYLLLSANRYTKNPL